MVNQNTGVDAESFFSSAVKGQVTLSLLGLEKSQMFGLCSRRTATVCRNINVSLEEVGVADFHLLHWCVGIRDCQADGWSELIAKKVLASIARMFSHTVSLKYFILKYRTSFDEDCCHVRRQLLKRTWIGCSFNNLDLRIGGWVGGPRKIRSYFELEKTSVITDDPLHLLKLSSNGCVFWRSVKYHHDWFYPKMRICKPTIGEHMHFSSNSIGVCHLWDNCHKYLSTKWAAAQFVSPMAESEHDAVTVEKN